MYFEITKYVRDDKKAYVTYSHLKSCWCIMGDVKISGFKFRMNAVMLLIHDGFEKKECVSYVGE